VHAKLHPILRKRLYDRGYYDIFIFDMLGNMIYSVYKESDYATNFDASGSGQWKNSGLGKAFRAAKLSPDNVSYIDWEPYGPSAGALAAFLSTGIRDESGALVGVYTIQLPPGYRRSIEEVQPECSLKMIADSFEGAINVAGLGRPTEATMEKPLRCFKGHSARSFLQLLDTHLQQGFPLGNAVTRVEDPYMDIRTHAADATCVFALAVEYLLKQGHSIESVQKPSPAIYSQFLSFIKTQVDFQGVSGQVKFSGNDKPNLLSVQQVRGGATVDVGLVALNKDITWLGAGVSNTSWFKEDAIPKDYFPYWIFQVFIPVIVICLPACAGFFSGSRKTY
jgi:hypothetical protein